MRSVSCLVHGTALRTVLIGSVFALSACGGGVNDDIVRFSRQNNSGTYETFREVVLGKSREFMLGSLDQSGSKDVVNMVGNTPNGIGYSGMGYHDPSVVKMLDIAKEKGGKPVTPNAKDVNNGTYPIARALHIYAPGKPSGAVEAYLQWIMSPEGQKIVEESGYVPIDNPTGDPNVPVEESATIKITGSDTMVNLAQRWAEAYQEKHKNVSVQVSGGGSGDGIAALIDGRVDLANASREMKPDEMAKAQQKHGTAPKEFTVGKDALAVYVHKDNPVDSISLPELAEIYGDGGTITKWTQLDPDWAPKK